MTRQADQAEAKRLRSEGWSVKQIASHLGASQSSVSVWVRDITLSESQRRHLMERAAASGNRGGQGRKMQAQARRIEWQAEGRAAARQRDSALLRQGCMLYWAEGAKTSRYTLAFANTDIDMMRMFAAFLRQELGVPEASIRLRVNCHLNNGLSIDEIRDHWLDALGLDEGAWRKPLLGSVPVSSKQKAPRHPYGCGDLSVNSVMYAQRLFGMIQEVAGIDRPEWLDGRWKGAIRPANKSRYDDVADDGIAGHAPFLDH